MSDEIDITQCPGKKQRLQSTIIKEVLDRNANEILPCRLIMTNKQYEMLKKTPEFGDNKEWKTYQAKDRIYYTPYNAMEIVIK